MTQMVTNERADPISTLLGEITRLYIQSAPSPEWTSSWLAAGTMLGQEEQLQCRYQMIGPGVLGEGERIKDFNLVLLLC